MTRRKFLRISGLGIAGAVFLAGANEFTERSSRPYPSPGLGVSPENAATANRDSLVKSLTGSSKSIVLPPGDYLLDNSEPDINIRDFGGTLTMAPGARLVLTDTGRRGITFTGGEGVRLEGLSATYRTLPSTRSHESTLIFVSTIGTALRNAAVEGSAAIGIAFHDCVRPEVEGAAVRNVMADGLHLANCRDARVRGLITENTGDDGLAIHNFAHGPDMAGAHASGITVRGSKSRGIAVIGQSDVLVEDFVVEGTAFSGISCAQEPSWDTRVPNGVRFRRGEVRGAGTVEDPAGKSSVRYGVHYERVGAVSFEDVRVASPATRGVYGDARAFEWEPSAGAGGPRPGGEATLANVEVEGAGDLGFALVGGTLRLSDLTATDCGEESFRVTGADLLTYDKLTSVNASRSDARGLAFNFEGNALVEGGELVVVDNQPTPTGYGVSTRGQQSGRMGDISDRIANGDLVVENHSGLAIDTGST